jgi:predicted DNA-binding transcriptional regulator AlpA
MGGPRPPPDPLERTTMPGPSKTRGTAEAAAPRVRRGPRKGGGTVFVCHQEIARESGVCYRTILRWVDKGTFPLPHSIRGTLRLWLRADYGHYIKTGRWPSHMKMIAKQS